MNDTPKPVYRSTKNYLNTYQTGMESGHYNVLVTAFSPDDFDDYIKNKDWEIYDVVYENKKGILQGATGRLGPYDLNRNPFYEESIANTEPSVKLSKNNLTASHSR